MIFLQKCTGDGCAIVACQYICGWQWRISAPGPGILAKNLKGKDNGIGCIQPVATMLNQYHDAMDFPEAEMILVARWLGADVFNIAGAPLAPASFGQDLKGQVNGVGVGCMPSLAAMFS